MSSKAKKIGKEQEGKKEEEKGRRMSEQDEYVNTFKSTSMINLSTIRSQHVSQQGEGEKSATSGIQATTATRSSLPESSTSYHENIDYPTSVRQPCGHQQKRRNTIDVLVSPPLSRSEIITVVVIVLFLNTIVLAILLTPVFVYMVTVPENGTNEDGLYSTSE